VNRPDLPPIREVPCYEVPSFTKPGASYYVLRIADHTWTCTCPAWQRYPGRICKHIEAVFSVPGVQHAEVPAQLRGRLQ
jgi:uncharacterized Zn finger protein